MTLRDMRDFSYDERMTTPVREHQVSEPPSLATFGARLAIIRWAMRWNLKEAALACNVPQGSWREWELFDRVPRNLVDVAGKISARTGWRRSVRSIRCGRDHVMSR